MCIDADVFLDLCELYPQTADDLKMRALERRQFFIDQLHKSEALRKRKNMAGLIGGFHDQHRDEVSLYDQAKVDPDKLEFGEDEIDEDSFKMAHETQKALTQANEMINQVRVLKKFVKNLHKEIEDGTVVLKRIAPSKTKIKPTQPQIKT